jgi:hypothetical protein
MHWEFDFWVQKTIVAFHLALVVTSQKLLNWIKEWGKIGDIWRKRV